MPFFSAGISLDRRIDVAILFSHLPYFHIILHENNLIFPDALYSWFTELQYLFPVTVVAPHRKLYFAESEVHRFPVQKRGFTDVDTIDKDIGLGRLRLDLQQGSGNIKGELFFLLALINADRFVHRLVAVSGEENIVFLIEAHRYLHPTIRAGSSDPGIIEIYIYPPQWRSIKRRSAFCQENKGILRNIPFFFEVYAADDLAPDINPLTLV